ncbi:MAG: 3-dehydroquinate synthase [Propionibacteriaceae bacterium]|jgi:3-dehydroquinate synthase|nr:3-dehydroquinate synthase [Propionibacteriaceae bacterium]
MTIWNTVDVATDHPYQVVLGNGAVELLGQMLDGVARLAVIYPTKLAGLLPRLRGDISAEVTLIEVPDAEAAKDVAVLSRCWETLAAAGFTRSDAIVGFGGGATTDLAGFVAATWLRGVRYLAVPTTLLSMVDASVGGKTGINLPAGKNLVGAFYEPYSVLADLDWLDTLPEREFVSGMAEVLKAGFIAVPEILTAYESRPSLDPRDPQFAELLRLAIKLKADVVAADLYEQTTLGPDALGREALNYGHTLAHAIERVEGYKWRHGEAVAIGMVFAAEVSHRLGMIDADLLARHRQILSLVGLPTSYSGDWPLLRATMSLDKKTRGSTLRLVLLEQLAKPRIILNPPESVLADAFAALAPR